MLNGQFSTSFSLCSSFSHTVQIKIGKSLDVVHGIRTSGRRIVGTDGTIELWWSSIVKFVYDIEPGAFHP